MKPTFHPIYPIAEIRRLTRHEINWPRCAGQNYRTTSFDSRGAPPRRLPSFRSISDSFSRRERVRHFGAEMAVFVLIGLSAGASFYACAVALNQFLLSH